MESELKVMPPRDETLAHGDDSPPPQAAVVAGVGVAGLVWTRFRRGVADRRSPFHTPTLVSTGPEGAPTARTVVLRVADPARRLLACHTNRRSPKVRQLDANPAVCWHVYDRGGKTQVTATGRAWVETDSPAAEARWQASGVGSRESYRRLDPPGVERADFDPPAIADDDGRERFAVIFCQVERLGWLWLHHTGHRRVQCRWDAAAGDWSCVVLTP